MPSKRADTGKWQGIVVRNGKRYRAQFTTRKAAAEWEVAKRKELEELEKAPKPTGTDFLTLCVDYMEHAELRFVSKVFKEKKALCERLVKRWGNPLVSDISLKMIEDYLLKQAKTRSANAYNKDRKNMLAMWTWGKKRFKFAFNPVAETEKLPHNRQPQYTPPTVDVLKVLAVATPEEKVFLQCYLHTGGRRSEIFAWTWNEDVNFERRQVRLGTRKTRDHSMEYQWLPMNDELYEALWWWWKNRPIKDTPYVFVSTSNRNYGQRFTTRRRFLKGLCKRAGVKPFEFHALRRYVASVLADTGKVSSKTIQRVLRHENLATTERYIQNINIDLAATMKLLVDPQNDGSNSEPEKRIHEANPRD